MHRARFRELAVTAIAAGLLSGAAFAQESVDEVIPRAVTIVPIDGVIAGDAVWQLAWQGSDNADGLVAAADGGLLFAQEQPNQIGKLDFDDRYSIYLTGTGGAGSLSIDRQGRLLAVERTCTDPGRRSDTPCRTPTRIARLTPERQVLADRFADGGRLGRLNDLVADRLGGAYFTVGGAYYVSADGAVTSLGDGLRTNGIMLSPDEQTLYVTNREVVVAFDVAADGSTSNRRDFATLEAGGTGDGMAVDADGRLYVTSQPGVQVFDARGEYLGLIPTPRRAISVAFAGPDKRRLYIVGSGALGPDGHELTTPEGVRNNAKTIYRIQMIAQGFTGRAK
jgi:gluconolactonase